MRNELLRFQIVGALMDPITIGTAIKAGASIVGGLLGRNKAPTAGDTKRATMAGISGQAAGARQAAEEYGFNPLTLLGVSAPIQAQAVDNSMFGQSIANAGLAIADGMTEASAQKAYLAKLEEQNADLRKALDHQTLRPKVGGIFPTSGPAASAAAAGVGATVPTVPGGPVVPGMRDVTTETPEDPNYPSYIDPDSVQLTVSPLWTGYMGPDGDVLYAPEGPDADELVTGAALDQLLKQRAADRVLRVTDTQLLRFDPFHRDGYLRPTRYGGN